MASDVSLILAICSAALGVITAIIASYYRRLTRPAVIPAPAEPPVIDDETYARLQRKEMVPSSDASAVIIKWLEALDVRVRALEQRDRRDLRATLSAVGALLSGFGCVGTLAVSILLR
jgi:hypothetical protein